MKNVKLNLTSSKPATTKLDAASSSFYKTKTVYLISISSASNSDETTV